MKIDECIQSSEVIECLKKFIGKPEGFLLLAGKNGTGKTYAAEAVFESFEPNKFHPEFEEKYFISQTDLNLIWQKQLKDWGTTNYLLEKYVYPELLVIDDLGTRIPSEAFMDFLYALADKRYRNKNVCGTIITTNLNSQDMRQKFGDAFVSRVASGKCFRFENEDRRFNDW